MSTIREVANAQANNANPPAIVLDAPVDADLVFGERLWIDASAQFSVNARLLTLIDGKAKLYRTDVGKVIEIEIDKLSVDDQAYCVALAERLKVNLPQVAAANLTPNELWAGKTLASFDTIDKAITSFALTLQTTHASGQTSIQKKTDYSGAINELGAAVKGKKARIHFMLDDVQPASRNANIGKDLTAIDITLTAIDRSLRFSPIQQTVVVKSNDAQKLNRQDVVRFDGQFIEKDAKTIAGFTIFFASKGLSKRVVDEFQEFCGESVFNNKLDGTIQFPFYVHSIRKLPQDEADALVKQNAK